MTSTDDGTGVGWAMGSPLPIIETSSAFSPDEHSKLDRFDMAAFDESPVGMQPWRHAASEYVPTISPEIRRELAAEVEMMDLGPAAEPTVTKTRTGAILLSPPLEVKRAAAEDDEDPEDVRLESLGPEFLARKKERMLKLKHALATENGDADEEERMPRYDGLQRLVAGQSGRSLGRGHAFYLQVMIYLGILLGIDRAFLGIFRTVGSDTSIAEQFPSSVFALVFVLSIFGFLQWLKPGFIECMVPMCRPGVWFLAEWRPLFFYVPLVKLPLIQNPPDAATIFLCLVVVLVGFMVNLSLSIGVARLWDQLASERMSLQEGVGYMHPRSKQGDQDGVERAPMLAEELSIKADILKRRWAWARLATLWGVMTMVVLVVSVLVEHWSDASQPWMLPYCYGFCSSVLAYILSQQLLPLSARHWILPPITFTLLAIGLQLLFAASTNQNGTSILEAYHNGTAAYPAPGDLLELLLGPSIISMALEILPEREHLSRVLPKICGVSAVALVVSLYSTAMLAGLFNLPDKFAVASVLHAIATPIAVGLANVVDDDDDSLDSLVVVFSCLSGLVGALLGRRLLTYFGIHDYAQRGLSVGISSHISGCSSLVENLEIDAASVATCSYVVVGVFACLLLSIPPICDSIVQIAR
eukprot:TRINITY_DN2000_c0_g1_i5.p1 TRINITY_DN2000_c0_g1~~TRINITY_DN2000_c0_g1_i5.p1  ORF type:complete len:642 (+),score=143.79 TRINITY_DN2000_c0_g1_i5:257-2182(+)